MFKGAAVDEGYRAGEQKGPPTMLAQVRGL